MPYNKNHKNKLSRFDAEREELKRRQKEQSGLQDEAGALESRAELLSQHNAERENKGIIESAALKAEPQQNSRKPDNRGGEEAKKVMNLERAESAPVSQRNTQPQAEVAEPKEEEENHAARGTKNKASEGVKGADIYLPCLDDVMFLENLSPKRRTDVKSEADGCEKKAKRNIAPSVVMIIIALLAGVGMLSAILKIMLPVIIICTGAVAFALVAIIFVGVTDNKEDSFADRLKKEKEREEKKKFKAFKDGKITAAKIIDYTESLGGLTASGRRFFCKIEYGYYDERGIVRSGKFEGELIPFFCDTFKKKGTLPVIFVKGKSKALSRFPKKRQ